MQIIKKVEKINADNYLICFAELNDLHLNLLNNLGECHFNLIYFKDVDWPRQFSIWPYQDFKGEGDLTLKEVFKGLEEKNIYVAGYSLGGLLALYSLSKYTNIKGLACVSGSLWYPDLIEYLKNHKIKNKLMYFSLGNKEAKTKNVLMRTVEEKTKEVVSLLKENNELYFEYNEGNHFNKSEERLIRGIKYLLEKGEL